LAKITQQIKKRPRGRPAQDAVSSGSASVIAEFCDRVRDAEHYRHGRERRRRFLKQIVPKRGLWWLYDSRYKSRKLTALKTMSLFVWLCGELRRLRPDWPEERRPLDAALFKCWSRIVDAPELRDAISVGGQR
jgi:hypothetical protein